MKKLRFICAQPATFYYAWQVEILINNFLKSGVSADSIHIVCTNPKDIPNEWKKLVENYKDINFFFYNDTRISNNYISSIRPNLLKQHFLQNPYLKGDCIFYCDCDIAFTKPINEWITEEMINDDNWYGSDCRWYISHSYIKSKGDDILKSMCSIVDIDECIVEKNELNCIGAQYLLKGIDSNFWNMVEKHSESLYSDITKLNSIKKQKELSYHELQIWCADMWAVLWNGWKMGYKTITHSNFDFVWATSDYDDCNKFNIFHNAGVTNSNSEMFFKSDYLHKLPYFKNLYVNKKFASYYYWQLINEVAKVSVLK